MKIRHATSEDLPEVIELLKASLGEGMIQKSLDLWNWKHIDNPHGASPVLIAVENRVIAGVRAFLKWQWQYNGKVYEAVRAVDTATHPDFQGKGIFKKLTLQGLEDAKQAGVEFVYNTPNENSKPGYLKMGWVEQGHMPLKLKVNLTSYGNTVEPKAPVQDWERLQALLPSLINPVSNSGEVHTKLSPAYINWRYRDNPLFPYYFITDYCSYLLFYRIKKHKFGQEMRVVDVFINSDSLETAAIKKLKNTFKQIAGKCFLVSASGRHYSLAKKVYFSMGLLPVMAKGPIVTLRNLQMSEEGFAELRAVDNWAYSLGDMELF